MCGGAGRRWYSASCRKAASRRRPGDIVRVVVARLVVTGTVFATTGQRPEERRVYDVLVGLPSWLATLCEGSTSGHGRPGRGDAVARLLWTRRFRLTLLAVAAGAASGALCDRIARTWADTDGRAEPRSDAADRCRSIRHSCSRSRPASSCCSRPFSCGRRGAASQVVLRPRVGREAPWRSSVSPKTGRHGWCSVGASRRRSIFALGTPTATPTRRADRPRLADFGVDVDDLVLANGTRKCGEKLGLPPGHRTAHLDIQVIGHGPRAMPGSRPNGRRSRIATPVRASRSTRTRRLEHHAYLLLLASKAGVPVGEVVIAGIAGGRDRRGACRPRPGRRAADHARNHGHHRCGARRCVEQPRPAPRPASPTGNSRPRTSVFVTTAQRRLSTLRTDRHRHRPNGEHSTRWSFLASTATLRGHRPGTRRREAIARPDGLAALLPLLESPALSPRPATRSPARRN